MKERQYQDNLDAEFAATVSQSCWQAASEGESPAALDVAPSPVIALPGGTTDSAPTGRRLERTRLVVDAPSADGRQIDTVGAPTLAVQSAAGSRITQKLTVRVVDDLFAELDDADWEALLKG